MGQWICGDWRLISSDFCGDYGLAGGNAISWTKGQWTRKYVTDAIRQTGSTTDVSQESLIVGSALTDLTIFLSLLNLRQHRVALQQQNCQWGHRPPWQSLDGVCSIWLQTSWSPHPFFFFFKSGCCLTSIKEKWSWDSQQLWWSMFGVTENLNG